MGNRSGPPLEEAARHNASVPTKAIDKLTIQSPADVSTARHPRREFLLRRLREADGPRYDELVGEVAEALPEKRPYLTGIKAARSVRTLLWDGLATTEPDGSVWLTPAGWESAR
jgi:hypothetical protein